MPKEKPWLSSKEQVAQLKQKGVSFQLMSEADAHRIFPKTILIFGFAPTARILRSTPRARKRACISILISACSSTWRLSICAFATKC